VPEVGASTTRRWGSVGEGFGLTDRVQVYMVRSITIMSAKELASLGAAEAEVLHLLWSLKEATAQQIWDNLPRARVIELGTVQTMLRRLREKGYVKHRVEGKVHVFLPAVKPERVLSKTVGDLLNRFFGGDAVPLMMHLAESRRISRADLKRLEAMLDRPKES
jgi:BlaI family transcriptional regulator, penicillinase repressor